MSGSGVRLEVSEGHWDADSQGQKASLRCNPEVRLCCLDWELAADSTLASLHSDVILGAGKEMISPNDQSGGDPNPIFVNHTVKIIYSSVCISARQISARQISTRFALAHTVMQ